MGSLCASNIQNHQIGSYMDNAESTDRSNIKLLLLGPGSTGKSTLFKSLQLAHAGNKMPDELKKDYVGLIRLNVLDCIKTLLKQSQILYQRDPILYNKCNDELDSEIKSKIDFINFYDELPIDETNLTKLGEYIKTIWNLPCIQATYNFRNNNFAISDNLQHFFSKIDTIFNIEYIPHEEDCLKNRTKTTGMQEYEYNVRATSTKRFKIVDVGGQRMERKKWMSFFDNVHGVLFVASLIDFNCVLYEDARVNSMWECVRLFSEITALQCFENCSIILILNKNDLLKQLLKNNKDNGLAKCFSKEGVWPNEREYWDPLIDEQYWPLIQNNNNNINNIENNNDDIDPFTKYHAIVIDFIRKLFLKRNNHHSSQIYDHISVATDNSIVKSVFEDISQHIIMKNIIQAGLHRPPIGPPNPSQSKTNQMINNGNNNDINDIRVRSTTVSLVSEDASHVTATATAEYTNSNVN